VLINDRVMLTKSFFSGEASSQDVRDVVAVFYTRLYGRLVRLQWLLLLRCENLLGRVIRGRFM
jgi:hypothetical protein